MNCQRCHAALPKGSHICRKWCDSCRVRVKRLQSVQHSITVQEERKALAAARRVLPRSGASPRRREPKPEEAATWHQFHNHDALFWRYIDAAESGHPEAGRYMKEWMESETC